MSEPEASKLAVFEGKRIRKILHEGEWWFSIIEKAGGGTAHFELLNPSALH